MKNRFLHFYLPLWLTATVLMASTLFFVGRFNVANLGIHTVYAAVARDTDTGTTCGSFCAATLTWSHTIGSITNGVLSVQIAHPSSFSASTVTWGGISLSLRESTTFNSIMVEVWDAATGSSSGTETVTVTWSATPSINDKVWGNSISMSGVDQSSIIDTKAIGTNTTTTTHATTLTTTNTGTFMIDILAGDIFTFTVDGSQTQMEYADCDSGGNDCGTSYKTSLTGAPGNYTMKWTTGIANSSKQIAVAYKPYEPIEQEGYRWRNDDGNETTATWFANQDTSASTTLDTNIRLRALLNATGTPSTQFKLEYREVGDSAWGTVTSTVTTITETVTTVGTSTWYVPFGVTSAQVYCWGAGGGGDVIAASGGGGGGGGAFASSTLTNLTAGASYSVFIGTGGTSGTTPTDGGDSYFASSSVEVLAKGGSKAANTTGGQGGATTTSVGTLKYKGGNGGTGNTSGDVGGGGGGAAGPTGAGGNGANGYVTFGYGGGGGGGNGGTDGSNQTGGTGGTGGGNGGAGDTNGSSDPPGGNGSDGTNGGGGAGGGDDGDPGGTGGAPGGGAGGGEIAGSGGGGNGQCKITYTPTHKLFLSLSNYIAASAASTTTAQLTAPTGKTTASSTVGRISDDTNPLPSISLSENYYTEVEWSIAASSTYASVGDLFEFRVTKNGTALETYSVTPYLEIVSGIPLQGYSYYRTLTIDKNKVASSTGDTYTNFPVLVSSTLASLKTVSNGGNVTSDNGYDIVFATSTTDGTLILQHEIEKYASTTGEFIAHVKLPSVSTSTNTTIYMFYGNSNVVYTQESGIKTWNSNYKSVWHMDEDPSLTAPQMSDSTSNGRNATSNGSMTSGDSIYGKIGKALDFDGSNDYLSTGITYNDSAFTYSFWSYGGRDTGGSMYQIGEGSASGRDVGVSIADLKYQVYEPVATGLLAGTFAKNTWHYLTYTHDGTTGRLYLNGTQVDSNNFSPATGGAMTIASYFGGFYWQGYMDEVRVSNTARSADWIYTEWCNQVGADTCAFMTIGNEVPTGGTPSTPPTPGAFNNTNSVVRIVNTTIYIKQ